MTLQSMTGFARVEGSSGRYRWAWELRSVNGKGSICARVCRRATRRLKPISAVSPANT